MEALEVQPWRDFWKAVGAPAKDIANSWRAFAARHARAAAPLITTLAQCAARHRYTALFLIAERTGMGLCALRTLADRRADSDVRYDDDDPWELRELPRDERDGLPAPPYTSSRPHTGFPQLPLGGLRVVESTRGVQGPLATSVLQALGAHVIRIEQPGGDPSRGAAPLAGGVSARFAALNAGKEIRQTDIRTAAGRSAGAETVAETDVFLHTWAPGEAARLRLDEEDLARARHTVRTPDGTPAPSLVTLLDVLGGHLAAESVLAALLARESGAATGRLRVDSSLLGASRGLLRPLLRGLDEAPGTQPAEAGLVAPTAEGLIAVGAGAGTTPAELATAPTAAWLGRLHAAGIPARAVVTDLAALPQDPALSAYFTHDGCARPTPPWSFA
ncbi:CoA transferase [Streptomyces cyaneofuscatus]|uniref:CoA transferase n=1 Tax=Streptomyces cyaneofuscatus TaxID=66883 RepID=UPI0036637712